MLRAVLVAARDRGDDVVAAFGSTARPDAWRALLEDEGVAVRILDTSTRLAAARAVARVVGEYAGPTVLHTAFTEFDLAAVAAARGRPRTAVFWHIHSRAVPGLEIRARNVIKYAAAGRRTAAILCVAPDIAVAVRRRGGPRRRVEFVANAIDTDAFPLVGAQERASARRAIGTGERAVLLHFGWDWERKGGDLFLRALCTLRDAGRPVLGVIVGGGRPAELLAAELKLGHDLTVLEPRDDLRPLHAAADVFVAASRAEGMPYSVTEALCAGVPVAATDIPGQRLLCEGLAAARLTALEAPALAAAVDELLDRSNEQAAIDATAAREQIIARYDLRPWVAGLLARYDAALLHQRAGSP